MATDQKTIDKIVSLRNKESTWADIAEAVDLPQGKCMFLYDQATVSSSERITGKTEDDLKRKIAKGRQEGLSWGVLSARSGKSEGYCRKAFEEVTNESARGSRVGKGGRYPEGEAPAKAAKSTKKAAKKTAKASKTVKKASGKAPAKKATKATKAMKAKKSTKKTSKKEAA